MNTFINPFVPKEFILVLLVVAIWSFVWKGYGLWIAAKHNQKGWFVAILILNTVGILEIFYVFKIAKKSWHEVKTDFKKVLS